MSWLKEFPRQVGWRWATIKLGSEFQPPQIVRIERFGSLFVATGNGGFDLDVNQFDPDQVRFWSENIERPEAPRNGAPPPSRKSTGDPHATD